MKFDFLTGGQEIKLAILVKKFCLFSSYFFASTTFSDGFFQFQDNKVSLKHAPGHNHENTIFQSVQCPSTCNYDDRNDILLSSNATCMCTCMVSLNEVTI